MPDSRKKICLKLNLQIACVRSLLTAGGSQSLHFQFFNEPAHIAQAAASLWVAPVAGTLICLNAGVDVVDDRGVIGMGELPANIPHRMLKAVTDEHIVSFRLLLVNTFAHLIFGEDRLAVIGAG